MPPDRLNRQLVEAVSWRLATELARRDPRLLIRELHPGGGQYDCLALMYSPQEEIAHLNRVGSVHVWRGRTGSHPSVWRDVLQDEHALAQWLHRLAADLELPSTLPSTTSRLLVYRVIAALLAHNSFAREAWDCRSGFDDSEGYGGGVRSSYFQAVRGAGEHCSGQSNVHAAYEYWFICAAGVPRAALHESGVAWVGAGSAFDLWALQT